MPLLPSRYLHPPHFFLHAFFSVRGANALAFFSPTCQYLLSSSLLLFATSQVLFRIKGACTLPHLLPFPRSLQPPPFVLSSVLSTLPRPCPSPSSYVDEMPYRRKYGSKNKYARLMGSHCREFGRKVRRMRV